MRKNYIIIALISAVLTLALNAPMVQSAISQIVTIAVDGGSFSFNNVKDAALSANNQINRGVVPSSEYIYNGTDMDRATVGSEFYAVKRANITTASVNVAFGFPAKKISIETPSTNTDEICIDYNGGTAACPAANTAGNDRMPASRGLILDDFVGTGISVIAASGTQTIYVRAWR